MPVASGDKNGSHRGGVLKTTTWGTLIASAILFAAWGLVGQTKELNLDQRSTVNGSKTTASPTFSHAQASKPDSKGLTGRPTIQVPGTVSSENVIVAHQGASLTPSSTMGTARASQPLPTSASADQSAS